jgi:hypothetical protein
MPSKRYEKRIIDYLTRVEIEAVIKVADSPLGLAGATAPCFCLPCRPGFGCRS